MRILTSVLLIVFSLPALAQAPAYNRNIGLMVNLNTSQMNISGGSGPAVTTGTQWSAGCGLYYRSATKNMFRVECQLAFEAIGSGRETYYQRVNDEWIRIYDRYRTLPITAILQRSIGWEEKWSVGIGFKSAFVLGYTVRHNTELPGGTSGIIFSPEVLKWYGAPLLQLSRHFVFADAALVGWYSVSPLINQYQVQTHPFGLAFCVKARLFTFN